jgi:two-component system LytT family sensor kinase
MRAQTMAYRSEVVNKSLPLSAKMTTVSPLRNRILQHILFWIVLYFFDVFLFGFDSERYGLFLKIVLLEMPGMIILAYVMMYWAIPKFFEGRYVQIAVVLSIVFFTCSWMVHALFISVSYYAENIKLWDASKILVRGFYLFANAAIAVIIKLTKLWYENKQRVTEMESTRMEMELKMLREQVNPHFLFNTLNNLYGLVERNATQAQEMIAGLSRILHFMLHESNQRRIKLTEEVACIRDYISLETVRYADKLSVSINVQPACETLAITPLVIFPFVENSFKHGASESIGPAWINIDFSIYKDNFVFKIENSKQPHSGRPVNGRGIGLSNTTRRLELIYGSDHTLQIIDAVDTYLVILKIRLVRLQTIEKKENELQMSHS